MLKKNLRKIRTFGMFTLLSFLVWIFQMFNVFRFSNNIFFFFTRLIWDRAKKKKIFMDFQKIFLLIFFSSSIQFGKFVICRDIFWVICLGVGMGQIPCKISNSSWFGKFVKFMAFLVGFCGKSEILFGVIEVLLFFSWILNFWSSSESFQIF